jgi:hypothetical protein
MSDYRIEKIRRSLTVVLADGSRIVGEVFLPPISRHAPRPEGPGDLLNDAAPFFALMSNGEVTLIAKANVAYAEMPVTTEEEFELATLGVSVEATLNNGAICTGCVFLEVRSDRPRLLDFLNSYSPRFLPVVDARQVLLVNTQIIAHVREVP